MASAAHTQHENEQKQLARPLSLHEDAEKSVEGLAPIRVVRVASVGKHEDTIVKKLKRDKTTDLPALVLVECGSFSPVTNFHLILLEAVRDYVMTQTKQFEVIGGIMSPVHDAYGKKSLIHQDHRVAICERAVSDSSWIGVSAWETKQNAWTRTAQVLSHYHKVINASGLYDEDVHVRLVMGTDVLQSFLIPDLWAPEDIEMILGKNGAVVIEREGMDTKGLVATTSLAKYKDSIIICPMKISNNISSTLVREQFANQMSAKYLLPDAAIAYIQEHKLYGCKGDPYPGNGGAAQF